MTLLLIYMIVYTSVLMLVALGGCFSEHSGVINIGLEGIMVFGALGGALVMHYMPDGTSSFMIVLCCILAAVGAGTLYSLLLAVAAVNFKADQTLVGTAMNMLGTAIATVLVQALTKLETGKASTTIDYGGRREAFRIFREGGLIKDQGVLAQLTELSWLAVLAAALLVLSWFILYKTRFGLRLRSCGEHPQASASVGINVFRMRYAGVMISGALGGLGGLTYITAAVNEWHFENGVAGFGFLALAVMIFGAWKPYRIALAALLFAFFRSLSNVYSGLTVFGTNIYQSFLNQFSPEAQQSIQSMTSNITLMLPYIVSLIVLIIFSKNSAAPKAEGIPYDKGMR